MTAPTQAAGTARIEKIREELAAEKKAEAVADPKEKLATTFRNTLELALRTDKPGEREAASAALVRLAEGNDLWFLDRLSDKGRDAPAPTTSQIAQGSALDWFLRQSPEQLRQQAERHAAQQPDQIDELRTKIAAFLNTLRMASQKVPA